MTLNCDPNFFEWAKNAAYLSVDTEGNARDVRYRGSEARTMGVSLAFRTPNGGIAAEYFAFNHKIGENNPEFFESVKELLEIHTRNIGGETGPAIVWHNGEKHDIYALELLGIDVSKKLTFDTLSMCHWIKEDRFSYTLDSLSRVYGGNPKAMSDRMKKIIELFGWENVPVDDMRPYSANDTVITLELFEKIKDEFFAKFPLSLWETELEFFRYALNPMEATGVLIDKELCEREIVKGEKAMASIVAQLGGLNPGSTKDLKKLILEELGLPVVKRSTKTGAPSFDKEAMQKYDEILSASGNPTARLIITYRGWQKVVSTNYRAYINPEIIGNDGRLRPNYKVHGTKTSRLSCGSDSDGKKGVKSPNLQNIPRISEKEWDGHLKQAFIPDDEYMLVEFDFSNLELRLTASYSADPKLVETFRAGRNVFDDMAKETGWPRDWCKTFVYATGYNAGDGKIARTFGISVEEARRMRMKFFSTYKKMEAFKEFVKQEAKKNLFIKYWTKRRRHFNNAKEAEHLSFNSLIQGGGAELVKNRMIAVGKFIDWHECKMVLQVHDSLVFLIKKGTEQIWIPQIMKVMEEVPQILRRNVPYTVEAKIWGSKATWNSELGEFVS